MLTREQIYTMIAIRNRPGSVFNPYGTSYRLPIDIIKKISEFAVDPNGDIAILMHNIAYGNFAAAKAMLDANPRLVLQAANVTTPSGLRVIRTTPLECALGGGDAEMAAMIAPYFDKIEGGEQIREASFTRYRPHIESMLNQPAYDFSLLISVIKNSSAAEITAALNKDFSADNPLNNALAAFRRFFTPGQITVGMHFNYQDLLRAFEVYDQEYDALYKSSGNDYDKLRLFSRQIIGFIQRSLPAVDRQIFAQGLFDVVENKAFNQRSFKFKYDNIDYPITAGDVSLSGLGFDYLAHWGARWRMCVLAGAGTAALACWVGGAGKLMSSKNSRLAELMRPRREEKTSRCVIC
jgi:hypothetical protein